jgi:hypothetical protein
MLRDEVGRYCCDSEVKIYEEKVGEKHARGL